MTPPCDICILRPAEPQRSAVLDLDYLHPDGQVSDLRLCSRVRAVELEVAGERVSNNG